MDDKVKEIWQTLEETYKKKPKLVLSVVGDSETFVPKVWSRHTFQTALIEAAKYSGGDTWILFRGHRKSSVSLMISEALDTYTHLENLQSYPEKSTCFPVKPISLSFVGDTEKDEELKELTGHYGCTLPGSQEEFEEYRLELEYHIHNQRVSFLDEAELKLELPVPVVRILVEGDLKSIQDIAESLNKNLPVVIVKGSGKAANLIVDYIERTKSMKNNAALLFGIRFRNKTFETLKKNLKQIKACEHLINIFDVENNSPASFLQVIGEAVVRTWAYSHFNYEGEQQDLSTSVDGEPIAHMAEDNYKKKFRKRQFRKCLLTSDYIKQSDAMPASIPLFFYFGYQVLQYKGKLLEYGYLLLYQALKANRCDYIYALVSDGVQFKATYLAKLYYKTFPVVTKTTYCCRKNWDNFTTIEIAPDIFLHLSKQTDLKPGKKSAKKKKRQKKKLEHFRDVSRAVRSLCCYLLKYNAEEDDIERRDQNKGTDQPRSRLNTEMSTDRSTVIPGPSQENENTKTRTYLYASGSSTEDLEREKNAKEDSWIPNIFQHKKQSGNGTITEEVDDTKKPSQDEINKDVLLWAIFAQREEIAELFWLHGNNHLVTSLICLVLLRKLSVKAEDCNEHNISRNFEEHAGLFEERVYMLLDLMYQENEKCAMATMDEESTVFGVKTTPLTFAYENLLYDVIAHPCSQRHMDRIWHKGEETQRKLVSSTLTSHNEIEAEAENGPDKQIKDESRDCDCFRSCCCRPDSFRFQCSPKTWYIINYVLFFVVLVSYSGFVLTSVSHANYTRDAARLMEYTVYIWGAGDLLEEYRPLLAIFWNFLLDRKCRRFLFQIKLQLNNFWNFMDLLSYISIGIALSVRHFGNQEDFTWSRRVFSLSLLIMYLRFLQAFLMMRTFGATLIMIKEMLKDLLAFIWLAIFVIVGVGMYYHANLWPDHLIIFNDKSIETWRIWKIISIPYWQLLGDSKTDFLSGKEDKEESNCTSNKSVWTSDPTQERCIEEEDWTVMVVAAAFMLFSNLLLVNLVIAKFSYTFAKVKTNSEKLWMFERYVIIKEFEDRIPSPFNLIVGVWKLIKYLYHLLRKIPNKIKNHGSQTDSDIEKKKEQQQKSAFLMKFQKVMATRVINNQRQKRRNKSNCV